MKRRLALLCTLAIMVITSRIWAGGSGLNVIVVLNQNSTNSIQLANAYCELRGVPPQNVLCLTNQWSGGSTSCTLSEFQNDLLTPLLNMMRSRSLTNQIQFVLLSMDLPYQVYGTNGLNSITSALFYGFKPDDSVLGSSSLPDVSSNSYAFSELPFPIAPPDTATTNSFLAMMLTDTNLDGAQTILGRGVASDSTFPVQTVYLEKSGDPARQVRFIEFDNAIFDTQLQGGYSMSRIGSSSTSFTNIFGLQTGLANLTLASNTFLPGAMGDSLTSFAGILFDNTIQTSLLAFLEAGATGSYGTVCEPNNYLQKFPNPLNYFYQSRGFSLAEAYYQSLENPYQGIIVGEPLSAPFARRGGAFWDQLPTNGAVLAGETNLMVQFNSASTNLPLVQVDLFIDGVWFETVTNVQPSAGDQLSLTLNGVPINYTVPGNATVVSVAAGLVSAINSVSNTTSVAASLSGKRIKQILSGNGAFAPFYFNTSTASDRVELHSLNLSVPAFETMLNVSPATNTLATTFMFPARASFLDSTADGFHYLYVTNNPAVGDWLQLVVTKTNGNTVITGVTNTVPNTTIGQMLYNLMGQIGGNFQLQSPDGINPDDFYDHGQDGFSAAEFIIFANSTGWPASRIQVTLNASSNLVVLPVGTNVLQDNLSDLQPRNFFYVASGAFSIPVNYLLDTTRIADGFHELTFVAYEGTSVRTQTRITRDIQVQNHNLRASFNTLLGGTNSDIGADLSFLITANTNNISSIQLFGTGGLLASVSNQPTASVSVSSTSLGLGLHPFYAIITSGDGQQFRTQTIWIRLIGPEPAFSLNMTYSPNTISWPATAGRSYDVLMTTNLFYPFQVITSLKPTNSVAEWNDTNFSWFQKFYRVRTSN